LQERSAGVKELALLLTKISCISEGENGGSLLDELIEIASHANQDGTGGSIGLEVLHRRPGDQRIAQAAADAILGRTSKDATFAAEFVPWLLTRGQNLQVPDSPVAETSGQLEVGLTRWPRTRLVIGRTSRWLVTSVIFALLPVVVSYLALPRSYSISRFLGHGDFAVLAAALAAASIGEAMGPAKRARGIRNSLILASVSVLLVCTGLLIAGITNAFPRLSPSWIATYSLISFGVATVLGIAVWAATTELPGRLGEAWKPGASRAGEGGKP